MNPFHLIIAALVGGILALILTGLAAAVNYWWQARKTKREEFPYIDAPTPFQPAADTTPFLQKNGSVYRVFTAQEALEYLASAAMQERGAQPGWSEALGESAMMAGIDRTDGSIHSIRVEIHPATRDNA